MTVVFLYLISIMHFLDICLFCCDCKQRLESLKGLLQELGVEDCSDLLVVYSDDELVSMIRLKLKPIEFKRFANTAPNMTRCLIGQTIAPSLMQSGRAIATDTVSSNTGSRDILSPERTTAPTATSSVSLKDITVEDVVLLLEALDLAEYRESFVEKRINGNMLRHLQSTEELTEMGIRMPRLVVSGDRWLHMKFSYSTLLPY